MAGIYAFLKGQFEFSFLCGVTSLGSITYHFNKESRFFNMDNIFAVSLLVVFLNSLVLSFYYNEVYFQVGLVGIFTAGFLIYYCGDPAIITFDKFNCCYRSESSVYNLYHNIWHLASGVGPFMSVYFFDTIHQSYHQNIRLYLIAIILGVFINSIGNYFQYIPYD